MAMEVTMQEGSGLPLEDRILAMCAEYPKGIGDEFIQKKEPQIDSKERVAAINKLLTMGKIELLKGTSGLIYRLKCTTGASQIKGIDNQDKLVYQVIESAGNKGIWIRDIRHRCNLMLTEVNKILKNLENRKLIKAVKSVTASKKKVYMLFNLEPDSSITGGAWYSGQDFESEFVDVLNQQCYKFLQQKEESAASETAISPNARQAASYASSEEVLNFISNLGISKVKLSVEDIETILNTLIYDSKVEMMVVGTKDGTNKLYKAVHSLVEATDMTRAPCAVCPVFDQCRPGGVVSPEKCVYMSEWMEY
ncbi:DNA-directed RNA polymerase III subunit RPC6-like [Styela clava]|uniref:DNA-directed RNA polymerase III subunit RPC6-like n=1 Tax=Styela clava TaxID=7725 RepID=UPI001939F246|nr:DNA-directed RNA polymerase III subunit RPC6-like [Styela clava]